MILSSVVRPGLLFKMGLHASRQKGNHFTPLGHENERRERERAIQTLAVNILLFVCVFYHDYSQFYKQHETFSSQKTASGMPQQPWLIHLEKCIIIGSIQTHWKKLKDLVAGKMSAYTVVLGFKEAIYRIYNNWLDCQIIFQQIKKWMCLLPYSSYQTTVFCCRVIQLEMKWTPLNQPTANFWQELLRNLP